MVQYAVEAQTSLVPLSWFHGSRVTTAHAHAPMLYISELCEDCACRREWSWLWNWLCVSQHPWQRTRDHGVWRLTSTAHCIIGCAEYTPSCLPHLDFSEENCLGHITSGQTKHFLHTIRNKGTSLHPQNVTIPAPFRAQSCAPKASLHP